MAKQVSFDWTKRVHKWKYPNVTSFHFLSSLFFVLFLFLFMFTLVFFECSLQSQSEIIITKEEKEEFITTAGLEKIASMQWDQ